MFKKVAEISILAYFWLIIGLILYLKYLKFIKIIIEGFKNIFKIF